MLVDRESVVVKPHSPPTGMLFYMDFWYDINLLEERRKKIDKILKRNGFEPKR